MRSIEVDGLRVSRIGLGTWQFGSREWGYGWVYDTEVAPALVRRAVELGITMLDTAELYGPGRSERIIGAALAGMPASERAGLIVATKFLPIAPAEPIVARQAAGSLRRLGLDSLDLWYVHWPNPFVSTRRVIQAVRPLVIDGVVRRFGVSNFSLARWREAERAAVRLGTPVLANQVSFSLLSPGPARDLVPHAAERGSLVVAYSPLAQGLLAHDWATDGTDAPTGRPVGGAATRLGIRGANPLFAPGGRRRAASLLRAVHEIAARRAMTPAQVALAWVLHHPNTVAIPGARTVDQLEENAAAADLVLSADEFDRLTEEARAFAEQRGAGRTRRGSSGW